MITIDGSTGEGGGQILRTALSLSLATGQPCRIDHIRAGREKPGLLRQHLTAVQAAVAISRARVTGAALGSQSLIFEPQPVEPGEYRFAVGTAGSATLVFQTVLLPLLTAAGPSTLTFEGGTHNPWAPPFDFLARVFVPIVNRLGPRVDVHLVRHGFYPAGGGCFTATIEPAPRLAWTELCDRGEIRARAVRGIVANLPRHIAEREVNTVLERLNWPADCGRIEAITGAAGPGNVLFVELESRNVTEIFTGFGEAGVPAEAVADRTVKEVRRYVTTTVPVGTCLADQLMPLFAMSGGSFRTLGLSRHARTNAGIVPRFVDVCIDVVEEGRDVFRVEIGRK